MSDSERFHALDAVRAFALLAGVAFHATLPFLPSEVPLWIVMDASRSPELGVLFFVLHVFRMTVFFLIAGFFARMSFHRRGAGGFVWDRLKRVAGPLVVFWPIVFAGIIAVIVWNASVASGGTLPSDSPPPPPMTVETFPLTHLWFLYVLLWLYAGALLLRGAVALVDRGGDLRRAADRVVRLAVGGWTPILPAGVVALALCLHPEWRLWFGIPTPDYGLVPHGASLAVYGVAFGLGWMVHRQQDLLQLWGRRFAFHLVLGAGFIVACLAIVGVAPTIEVADGGGAEIAFAVCYGLATWFCTLGIVGAAVRFLPGHSPARRYVADASYWIYLVHIPVVMALHVAAARVDLPWTVKYPLVLAAALAILFVSYQLLVRHSFIGRFLTGRRKPKKAKGGAAEAALEPA